MPNGWRYPLVGGTRERQFDGTNSEPRKLPENAQTPTSRVHAVLGGAPSGLLLPELLNVVVVSIGDIDIAFTIQRDPARTGELTIARS